MGHEIVCDQRLQIFSDEKDVIVTTYKVKLEGTYDGKDHTGTYNAGLSLEETEGTGSMARDFSHEHQASRAAASRQ